MAFDIKVYAGTASDSNDLFNKLVNAFKTVYGYDAANATSDSKGWKVTKVNDSLYVLESVGELGVDDLCYTIENTGTTVKISGYMNYDPNTNALSTYGINDKSFGYKSLQLSLPTQQFWIYGNSDFIHIITKGYGVSLNTQGATTPQIVSFGKFIPTYNPAVTNPTDDTLPQGGDVVIAVNDASIFEVDRYVMISSAYTFEKVLVTDVDVAGNSIRVSNIVQTHQKVGDHPIIIGEIAKPYYIWQNYDSSKAQHCNVLPHIGGNTTVTPTDETNNQGIGVPADIFTSVATLAEDSALDRLNYDRYMFELYIHYSTDLDQGFYGKIPFVYCVGSNNINSETTVINDNAYLYRVFSIYNYPQSYAFRESYK